MTLILIQIIVAFIAIKLDTDKNDTILLWGIYLIPFIGLLLAGLMTIVNIKQQA